MSKISNSFPNSNVNRLPSPSDQTTHTLSLGAEDFLLDGKPLQIRCGEIHFARVPPEYWRHRLQLIKAMGLNTVCAYLFWNFHEWTRGDYDWTGPADAAAFCRIAQEEGLWVVLRPGPYVCAEWDGGGLPWWLLKNEGIELRSNDPDFIRPACEWLKEVGRVLGPLQVTKGGPILLVQVENEYGFYGEDPEYMGRIRDAIMEAGFEVPLFSCNPVGSLRNGWRDDLFAVVNFGGDPETGFARLRELQPRGPLMCGEFYSGWFDTWGAPHHGGNTESYLKDLAYMLDRGTSFSIYMAHGGTSFGMWGGADRPFKPDTSSYDYDAPVSEAGWIGEKFRLTRDLMAKHLLPGETLPEPPAPNPVASLPRIDLTETAPLFANLPQSVSDSQTRPMELYDQGRGCILYRTTLPAGPATTLSVERAHDFAWVFIDGQPAGVMDRRSNRYRVELPTRSAPAQLDILVEAMGHVNFGREIHDRKGLHGTPVLAEPGGNTAPLSGPWEVFNIRLDEPMLAGLQWSNDGSPGGSAFWRGSFDVDTPTDTFLNLESWGKGVIWVNGHCLGRFWNVGPTQTAYLPGVWLRKGRNEVVIFDLLGPERPTIEGLDKPILSRLRPELDFFPKNSAARLLLEEIEPVHAGAFSPGDEIQDACFSNPVSARQVCIETLSAHDGGPFAAIAEIDLLDSTGNSLPHTAWTVIYADSEELTAFDGSASNVINGQASSCWQSAAGDDAPGHPHHIVIDLGEEATITGIRYTPRQGDAAGRIKDYRIYAGSQLVTTDAD